jgi:hypothetical protein
MQIMKWQEWGDNLISDSESDMKLGVTSHVTISEASYHVSPLTESSRNVAASVADAQKMACPYLTVFR